MASFFLRLYLFTLYHFASFSFASYFFSIFLVHSFYFYSFNYSLNVLLLFLSLFLSLFFFSLILSISTSTLFLLPVIIFSYFTSWFQSSVTVPIGSSWNSRQVSTRTGSNVPVHRQQRYQRFTFMVWDKSHSIPQINQSISQALRLRTV